MTNVTDCFVSRNSLCPEEILPVKQSDHAEGHPFHPMPQGIPVCLAYRQLLLLKAETAFRLHLYSEVKSISACLGGKYKHIEKLINNITDNDNLLRNIWLAYYWCIEIRFIRGI